MSNPKIWAFMVPYFAGSFSNGFKVSWFGFWPAVMIVVGFVFLASLLFNFILDRFWTPK